MCDQDHPCKTCQNFERMIALAVALKNEREEFYLRREWQRHIDTIHREAK